jgi:hypothetical protein
VQPASDGSAPDSARQLRRWGPAAVVIGLVAVVGIHIIVSGGESDDDSASGSDVTGGSGAVDDEAASGTGAPEPMGQMSVTYAEAAAAGTLDDHDWGERCDPAEGRLAMPTVYAAPCVPVFDGDNGGATAGGVSAEKITIVYYDPASGADFSSMLAGAGVDETDEDQLQTVRDYFELYTSMIETYGREVDVVAYKGTGAMDDEVAARADAIEIAEDLEPFAVIGGPLLDRGAFAEELASRGVICTGCAVAVPDCVIQDNAPYNWGGPASAEQFLTTLLAWLGMGENDGFVDGTADFAGDPAMTDQQRRFGVVHFQQDPPLFGSCGETVWAEGFVVEPYLLDFSVLSETAVDIVAKLKDEGVTSVIFLGDPLMPIYLTSAATNFEYYPEWIFTGTVLTDSNVFGRQYDQEQMAQAFGLAQTAVPVPQELQSVWAMYKWYFGADEEPPALSQYGVIAPNVQRLAWGIHMAGPELTAETYEKGLFRMPPVGGGPTTGQVSYGNWGLFDAPDYFATDDMTEIWWDAEAVGVDEIGREGTGMWRHSNGGSRFVAADAPAPTPFVEEGSITIYEALPPEDQPPEYPPPPSSPAAG